MGGWGECDGRVMGGWGECDGRVGWEESILLV